MRIFRKLICFSLLAATGAILLLGCAASGGTRFEAEFFGAFDTVTKVVGYAGSKQEFEAVAGRIKNEMDEYNNLFDIYHTYDGLNNLKTINDQAGKAPVKVDSRMIDLLLFAKEMYGKTDGKVNVAMGAVLSIWHDYREDGIEHPSQAQLPPDGDLAEAAKHIEASGLVIDEEASTVFLRDPEMSLDVGAVAKGYAVEQVAKGLEADGITSILISAGGNIRAVGGKGGEDIPWEIGIRDPWSQSDQALLGKVPAIGTSLVTSGTYERYYTVDGKKYAHIIDPVTNYPAEYIEMVTIMTPDSGLADALSTALFNMSYEQGSEYLKTFPDAEALWVLRDGQVIRSEGFPEFK